MNKNIIKTVWVLIINKNEEILLVEHKKWAWHIEWVYGLPAWRVENQENILDCATRELKEETWLNCRKEDLTKFDKVFFADIERSDWTVKSFSMEVFLCKNYTWELKSDFETIPHFVKLTDISKLDLLPSIKEILSIWEKLYKD